MIAKTSRKHLVGFSWGLELKKNIYISPKVSRVSVSGNLESVGYLVT